MKHFIACLVFCALVYQARCGAELITRGKLREVRKQCVDEVGLGRVLKGNHTEMNVTAKVMHTRKCVKACVDKKLGLIDSEGKIDKEKVLEKMVPKKDTLLYEKISEALTKCADQHGDDICETHYLVMECLKEFRPFPRMKMNDV